MILGKVVGTIWATRKDEKIEGLKLQIVKTIDLKGKTSDNFVIAADTVQAGIGDTVLVAQGSSARQTTLTKDKPIDAVIMAVVDKLDFTSEEVLDKDYSQRKHFIEDRIKKSKEI